MFLANDTSNPLKYKKIGIKNGHSKNRFEWMLWFFFLIQVKLSKVNTDFTLFYLIGTFFQTYKFYSQHNLQL